MLSRVIIQFSLNLNFIIKGQAILVFKYLDNHNKVNLVKTTIVNTVFMFSFLTGTELAFSSLFIWQSIVNLLQ